MTDLPRNLGWGALEYSCGRHLARSSETDGVDVAASSSAVRVLAVLTAAWALQSNAFPCDALRGVHFFGCPHQRPTLAYSRQWLANEAFGAAGGSQRNQVNRALLELACEHVGYLDHEYVDVTPVLALQSSPQSEPDGVPRAHGHVRFHKVLKSSMFHGHVQRIPIELIRDLPGDDVRPWIYALMRANTSRTGRPGRYVEFSVTGPRASVYLAQIGLGKSRPDRIARALERSAAAGNKLQSDWEMAVLPRRQGGVKLRLTRRTPRLKVTRPARAA